MLLAVLIQSRILQLLKFNLIFFSPDMRAFDITNKNP